MFFSVSLQAILVLTSLQDSGLVPNLKWSFSDSRTRLLRGGWVREQVIQDLPSSHDISAAQQHLKKGAVREVSITFSPCGDSRLTSAKLHWHRVAEWGFVYAGSVLISAVDEFGRYQVEKLNYGGRVHEARCLLRKTDPGVRHLVLPQGRRPHCSRSRR